MLAGVGIGLYSRPDIGIEWDDQPVTRPNVDGTRGGAYEVAFRTYASLYPHLAAIFAGAR